MKVVAVLCLLAATALQVYAFPTGAPLGACADIQPMGPHIGNNPSNSANISNIPFQLDLSQFRCPSGVAGYCYVPGATYQRKLLHCRAHKIGIHVLVFSLLAILQLLCLAWAVSSSEDF